MVEKIESDEIDILIDLAGHTKGNRLSVFQLCSTPIKISYLGHGYTTGLPGIDYFLSDENLTPIGADQYFSEKIWRLPAPIYFYAPPRCETPNISQLPATKNGFVTFGCLSRTVRFNDCLLNAWKKILDRVPNSVLRLDQVPFNDEKTRNLFYKRFELLGISRNRVKLTFNRPHWDVYNEIDISLDCFPHNAGTTTFESLWMGVPVLSKIDRPSVGCIGAAILKPLGLGDWLADDIDSYIQKAVMFASNVSLLSELRTNLRSRLESSLFMQPEILARNMENSFLQMIKEKASTQG